MRHPIIVIALALAVSQAGIAFAQDADRIAPGESSVSVVNGRIHHTPKRFSSPAYLAERQERRDAKASRTAARASRNHGVAVSNGRMTFAPKPAPTTAFAITDQ